jgi:DNA-directed RNA polymerase I, II, and III subunit RPABC1
MDRMNEVEVKRAILIVQQNLTAFAKQAIVEICATEGLALEQFQEAELLVNITEHVLVPLHVVLNKDEKQVGAALPPFHHGHIWR